MEAVAPDLYARKRSENGKLEWTEARIDLIVHFPGHLTVGRIDVTVRSPYNQGLGKVAGEPKPAVTPGTAAAKGATDKKFTYGEGVIPFVVETGGRIRSQAMTWMRTIAKHMTRTRQGC